MAWNGSDKVEGEGPKTEGRKAKSPCMSASKTHSSFKRGAIAGLIVVAIGCAAVWWLAGERADVKERDGKSAKSGSINEVKPQLATNADVTAGELVQKKRTKKIPYWKLPSTNGLTAAQIRKWKFMHEPPPRYTNNVAFHRPPPKYAIFRHRSENELAMLMTMEPGMTLIGTPVYGDKMREDFLKSCEEPIVAEEGDTEEQKALKREMNQVKIEIRERMRNGEDFCDILRETRAELMRMNQVKRDIQGELATMLKSAGSADDVDACFAAANKLLESKGIAPLPNNPILRRRLERQILNRKQKEEQ